MKSIQETIIKITKAPILCSKCAKKSEIWLGLKDVVSFGDGEFLTDLGLTLVNSLKTLASEHVNRFAEKLALKQKHKLIYYECNG